MERESALTQDQSKFVENSGKRHESPPRVKSPKEDILTSREKTTSEKIGRGITNSSFVELKDDGKGVFKTAFYQNERAAYLIDRFLGFNLTPPTAIRVLDGEMGSMQEFIPDSLMYEELEDDYDFMKKHRPDLMKMWIFDIIIGNLDRHGGNFLIQGDNLYAIDHGYSLEKNGHYFLENIDLYVGYYRFFDKELPQEMIGSIKNFLERPEEHQILEELLTELFDQQYATACLKRIKIIGEMLVKNGKISRPQGYDSIKIL